MTVKQSFNIPRIFCLLRRSAYTCTPLYDYISIFPPIKYCKYVIIIRQLPTYCIRNYMHLVLLCYKHIYRHTGIGVLTNFSAIDTLCYHFFLETSNACNWGLKANQRTRWEWAAHVYSIASEAVILTMNNYTNYMAFRKTTLNGMLLKPLKAFEVHISSNTFSLLLTFGGW